jgi:hypothetical protein
MARATTWDEFKEKSSSEKRVIALIKVRERAVPANVLELWFSNIEREEPSGFPFGLIHKGIKSVPSLKYNTNEIGGTPPTPSWSNLVLVREDGYDISNDESGIYFDDLGEDWIIENQPVFTFFGGDDLPWSEYKQTFAGTMRNPAKSDMTLTIPCQGNENRAYRDTVAGSVVTVAAWPNAPTGSIGLTIPFCSGFVWNPEPICVDGRTVAPNNLRYIFHDNTVAYSSIGVYDAGVALTAGVQYTDNLDGTFTLAAGYVPVGRITCFVVGAWGFSPWATVITNLLQTFAGTPPAQIDAAAVAAADAAMPYAVSFLVQKETPAMEVIRQLSVGIPAYYSFQRDGVFRMREITDPALKTPDHTINSEISNISPVAILDNSLSIAPSGEVVDTVNVDYYENYAVIKIDNLSNTLTETQKSTFYTEYRQDTYFDPTVATSYDNPAKKNVLMRVSFTAATQSAAVKWVDLLKISRTVTKFKVKCQDLIYNIGDIVSVTFETELKDGSQWYRHNYNDRRLMVIGINEDYDKFETTLTLWG